MHVGLPPRRHRTTSLLPRSLTIRSWLLFDNAKSPNPTPIRGKWIPNYEFGDLSKGLAKRAKGVVLNYTGKSDYIMFGDNEASTEELEWWEGCKTSWLRVPFVKLD